MFKAWKKMLESDKLSRVTLSAVFLFLTTVIAVIALLDAVVRAVVALC